jgi:chemotaxis protein MotB
MMCLLLSFFVLLLSFSNLEVVKFRQIAGSVRNAFGTPSDVEGASDLGSAGDAGALAAQRGRRALLVKLRAALEHSALEGDGTVEVQERGVALRLSGDAVFDSASTALQPGASDVLDRLAEIAMSAPGDIEIEGHTDDVPIHNAHFPSNWELSAARAGSAVRYLTTHGVPPQRVKAIGYGETRALVPNDSEENRAKNRRVEFLFVTGQDGGAEP